MGKDNIYTCACSADIVIPSDEGSIFLGFLTIIRHLNGAPHLMAEPVHVRSSEMTEIFSDGYNPAHQVVISRNSS